MFFPLPVSRSRQGVPQEKISCTEYLPESSNQASLSICSYNSCSLSPSPSFFDSFTLPLPSPLPPPAPPPGPPLPQSPSASVSLSFPLQLPPSRAPAPSLSLSGLSGWTGSQASELAGSWLVLWRAGSLAGEIESPTFPSAIFYPGSFLPGPPWPSLALPLSSSPPASLPFSH